MPPSTASDAATPSDPATAPDLTLVIANKNYSSWSLRPWLAMTVAGIPFAEAMIPLDEPDTRARVLAHSPAGRVPVLKDGEAVIWESTAILEHLAERFPEAGLWPADAAARAMARSIVGEMHAGFQALRNQCPMNMRRPVRALDLSEATKGDVARVEAAWAEARRRFGQDGPFLFGAFGAADAMYAPLVNRFHVYAVPVSAGTRAYMDAMMALPAWQAWEAAGRAEPWVVAHDEA